MKTNSQYTAAITGCAYLFGEFLRVLPLMMADNREALLKMTANSPSTSTTASPPTTPSSATSSPSSNNPDYSMKG